MRIEEFAEKNDMFNDYFKDMKQSKNEEKLAMEAGEYIIKDIRRHEKLRHCSYCHGYLNALYENKILLENDYFALKEELYSICRA